MDTSTLSFVRPPYAVRMAARQQEEEMELLARLNVATRTNHKRADFDTIEDLRAAAYEACAGRPFRQYVKSAR